MTGASSPSGSVARTCERFLQALLDGDVRACLDMPSGLNTLEEQLSFMVRVIQPAMDEVGRLWANGKITITREHQASSIVGRVLSLMHTSVRPPQPTKGRAVVSSVTNDYHELGAWIVADVLELDGWEVRYLGANAPADDLMTLMMRCRPHLLGLSVTIPTNIEQARRIITAVRSSPVTSGVMVLVGGRAVIEKEGLWRELGADGGGRDAAEAVALAADLWEKLPAERRL